MQARELWAALPGMLFGAQQWLMERGLLSRELSVREAIEQSPVGGTDAVGAVVAAIWGFVGGIFGLVAILILAFYLLLDGDNLVRLFVRLFPPAERPRVEDACRRVTHKVSAWLGGQLLLGGIIGTTAAVGLFLMGVPYFYVLALIAGIGEMIPIVGPLLAAVPAVAIGFSVSPALALGVAVFFVLQQQVENHVLVPKIMERQVGVSAVAVIVALLLGGTLLGIVGAILAVPTVAVLQVLFEELVPEASRE
jgi:predicted PurR-regulated permease PerM